jgi:hypothetical protein
MTKVQKTLIALMVVTSLVAAGATARSSRLARLMWAFGEHMPSGADLASMWEKKLRDPADPVTDRQYRIALAALRSEADQARKDREEMLQATRRTDAIAATAAILNVLAGLILLLWRRTDSPGA